MKKLLSFILLLINISSLSAQNTGEHQPLSIVPYPLSVKAFAQKFVVSGHTTIRIDANNPELRGIAQTMAGALKNLTGYPIAINTNNGANTANSIVLTLNHIADTLGDEGYRLSVHSGGIYQGQ